MICGQHISLELQQLKILHHIPVYPQVYHRQDWILWHCCQWKMTFPRVWITKPWFKSLSFQNYGKFGWFKTLSDFHFMFLLFYTSICMSYISQKLYRYPLLFKCLPLKEKKKFNKISDSHFLGFHFLWVCIHLKSKFIPFTFCRWFSQYFIVLYCICM